MIAALVIAILARAAVPDRTMTPGAVAHSDLAIICGRVPRSWRTVSPALRRRALDRYGIAPADRGLYVVDHLVPVELGGASEAANLWPQVKIEGRLKDKVENALRHEVCGGRLTLDAAVAEIEADWRAAYLAHTRTRRHR